MINTEPTADIAPPNKIEPHESPFIDLRALAGAGYTTQIETIIKGTSTISMKGNAIVPDDEYPNRSMKNKCTFELPDDEEYCEYPIIAVRIIMAVNATNTDSAMIITKDVILSDLRSLAGLFPGGGARIPEFTFKLDIFFLCFGLEKN